MKVLTNNTQRPVTLFALTFASLSVIAACANTVDLGTPAIGKSAPPTCAVSAGDYRILSYWNDRSNDKQYVRIIAALEKKYVSAPKVGTTSAVVAAQSYVRQNAAVAPLDMEAKIAKSCAS